ncbi:hypothetical protein CFP56_021942 [Quercus suber]|uniref:AB hydrolase-1 domain-containing protein n=1 Tax=Quercus suber TaxID=58331 RepID=A0AAW0KG25_QUESU
MGCCSDELGSNDFLFLLSFLGGPLALSISLLWKSHIKRPMILVGPCLGAAVATDFVVKKLVLIDASVHAEVTGNLATLPRIAAYAGVSLFIEEHPAALICKCFAFTGITFGTSLDWTNVGRLHCLYPWWEDATVDFMISGGYNVSAQIQQVYYELRCHLNQQMLLCCFVLYIQKRTLVIKQMEWEQHLWHVKQKTLTYGVRMSRSLRLHCELPNATIRQIPDCGHLPDVKRPNSVAKLIVDFVQENCYKEIECVSQY